MYPNGANFECCNYPKTVYQMNLILAPRIQFWCWQCAPYKWLY